MKQALKLAEGALRVLPNSPICPSQASIKTLKMLNVHNAEEAFLYQKKFCESRIRELVEDERELLIRWIRKGLEMMKIEDELVERGLIQLGDCDKNIQCSKTNEVKDKLFSLGEEEETSLRMSRRVVKRCNELLKFNIDRQESKQEELCRSELQKTVGIMLKLKKIAELLTNSENPVAIEAGNSCEISIEQLDDTRLQKKIQRLRCQEIREVYGSKNFSPKKV